MDAPRPVPIFRARVNELGQLAPLEVGRWAGYLARLRGKSVEVIVRPERKHRSLTHQSHSPAHPTERRREGGMTYDDWKTTDDTPLPEPQVVCDVCHEQCVCPDCHARHDCTCERPE